MQVLQYPHPTLRHKAKPLKRVDAELRKLIGEMYELMYQHKGIGLAATQVDLPYRLFVLNLEGEAGKGEEYTFINPVISKRKGSAEAEEGCLSLPGLYADVRRPERITLNAYSLAGEEVTLDLDGLFARAVQHEVDHLDGVLFIDRLATTTEAKVREALADFQREYEGRLERGELPNPTAVAQRLAELEKLRT